MRYAEIKRVARIPDSHPHVSEVGIDPADHHRLTRMADSRPELKVLGADTSKPDRWTVYVGCASHRVQADFDDWLANVL